MTFLRISRVEKLFVILQIMGESFRLQLNFILCLSIYFFQISSCVKIFAQQASLKCHFAIHEEDDNFKGFKEHQFKHKKLKFSLELLKKGYKTIQLDGFKLNCQFCNKKSSKPSQVVCHERIHTSVRPFKCKECGNAFTQKQSLDSHMLKHTSQKPYACSFC